ncbi:LacI family transcriptional regulator [Oscillospiraceae bacterium HV4-5-C5C]|nr:LacI family transcriptional regulator [Oscillospiraceae bacterium HV4-5-C5C]
MVTLKDIARQAGVSVMTVSRVVNGQLSKVSKENIDKIQKIIEETHYVPNSSARSLSSRSSHIVALVISGESNQLSNPYNAILAGEVIERVQKQGYYVMVHFISHYEDITQRLRAWNAEGAIFFGTFDQDIQKIMFDNRIALVFTDSYTHVRQVTNVGLDDYKGGVLAAEHFIQSGHQTVAFMGTSLNQQQLSSVVNNRLDGYRDTLEKAGLALPDNYILDMSVSPLSPAQAVMALQPRPTAILVAADLQAVELIQDLKQNGLRVPEDLSVIGFDDLPLARMVTPRLTTIRQDLKQKAQVATELLFRHIQDPYAPAENIILDVELLQRDSTASPCPDQP